MNFNSYLKEQLDSDPELGIEFNKLSPLYRELSGKYTIEEWKLHLLQDREKVIKTHYTRLLFSDTNVTRVYFALRNAKSNYVPEEIMNNSNDILKILSPIPVYYSILYFAERHFLIKILL